jgi:hypothetical protein
MAIAATIEGAKLNDDGTVRLNLGPLKGEGPGQDFLTVVNPPANRQAFMNAVIGQVIWGGSSEIMVGQTKWAERVNYTEIKLVDVPVGDGSLRAI